MTLLLNQLHLRKNKCLHFGLSSLNVYIYFTATFNLSKILVALSHNIQTINILPLLIILFLFFIRRSIMTYYFLLTSIFFMLMLIVFHQMCSSCQSTAISKNVILIVYLIKHCQPLLNFDEYVLHLIISCLSKQLFKLLVYMD